VLALGDLTTLGNVTLPIWRADSINVPRDPATQQSNLSGPLIGRRWKELHTSLPDSFPVPVELAIPRGLTVLRNAIETSVGVDDYKAAEVDFEARLSSSLSSENLLFDKQSLDNILGVAKELFRRLYLLRTADRDGIWARIIENSFMPPHVGRQCGQQTFRIFTLPVPEGQPKGRKRVAEIVET
jgi:hypothetical protein